MKKCVFFVICFLTLNSAISEGLYENGILIPKQREILSEAEKLALLVACHESGLNSNAFNEKEDAVGILQIRPIMVKEVNRWSGKKFNLDDRLSPEKSIEMFVIFQNRYNPELSEEKACRLWNGGGRGLFKSSTRNYYLKFIKNRKLYEIQSIKTYFR